MPGNKTVRSPCQGSAVIEVAIMLPVVLMLVFGFILFSTALRTHTVLEVAAREGAIQYAVTNNAREAAERARYELALGGVDPTAAAIRAARTGRARTVTVTLPYPLRVPFAGTYDLKLQGAATFELEQNPGF